MQKMQEQFSAKESIQRKGDPMPLAFCAPSVLSGFAPMVHKLEGTPVPPAKCGIPAAPLRAIPDKTASARRGIRERVEIVGWGELVNPNKLRVGIMLGFVPHPNLPC
jgi:hypothetical protein